MPERVGGAAGTQVVIIAGSSVELTAVGGRKPASPLAFTVSLQNRSWSSLKQSCCSLQLFQGNVDNNTHKKNVFEPPFYARYVRVLPWEWHERITLRMELLGCDN